MVFRRTLPVRERVTDLALTPCGNYIIAVGGEGLVRLFNLARRNDEGAVLHHFQARHVIDTGAQRLRVSHACVDELLVQGEAERAAVANLRGFA